jgi:hypothetical protein
MKIMFALFGQSADCVIRLLKGQVNLSDNLEADELADVIFLGEIYVSENISSKLRSNIALLSAKLKEINARGYIRSVHNKVCEGVRISLSGGSAGILHEKIVCREPWMQQLFPK